jgi:hypothetical protein
MALGLMMLRLWGYKEAGRRNLCMLQELCMYEVLEYAVAGFFLSIKEEGYIKDGVV